MAPAVALALEPEPAPRAHPLNITAQRRFIHLKVFCQFRGPGLSPVGNRDKHAELARLQSRACQRAVIDRGDHPIQLADASTDAYAFDSFDRFVHSSLYMHAFAARQVAATLMAFALMISEA